MSPSPGSQTKFATVARIGLLVGTLDIIAAILLTLSRGGQPLKMLQFIASGVFGSTAFSGGWLYGIFGLILHYCIAMVWTIIFFLLARRFITLRRNPMITGIVYGIFVWVIMNQVVLPLSRTPPLSFNPESAIIGALVLIAAIGLPLSYLSRRFVF